MTKLKNKEIKGKISGKAVIQTMNKLKGVSAQVQAIFETQLTNPNLVKEA